MGFSFPWSMSVTICLISSKADGFRFQTSKLKFKIGIWNLSLEFTTVKLNFGSHKPFHLHELNFPKYPFRFKNSENKISIFDTIRKRFVILQPEEWVRQHCVQFLLIEKNIPISLINIEKELLVNGLRKRYDIVVFKPNGDIHLIVECKAPSIHINQDTF